MDVISLQLKIEDATATEEKLQSIASSIAYELEEQDAKVSYTATEPAESEENLILIKGDKSISNLLNVEVNLENIAILGRWIYERIAGTSTKVILKHGETEFRFEGLNPPTNKDMMERLDRLIGIIEVENEKR